VQTGCGVSVKRIRGRPYLYFWHYEDRGGRRVQVQQYLGAPRAESTRQRLTLAVETYYDRLQDELRRRRQEALSRLIEA
jgi:hypothetical protein